MKRIGFLTAIFCFIATAQFAVGQDRTLTAGAAEPFPREVVVVGSPYSSAYFIMHDDKFFGYDIWDQGQLHAGLRDVPNPREKLDICFADVKQAPGSAWCVNVSSVHVKVNENLNDPVVTFVATLPNCCPDELTLSVPLRRWKESFPYEAEMAYAHYMKAFFEYKYDFYAEKARSLPFEK